MEEVPTEGGQYTWNNKRTGEHNVHENFDRVVANKKWIENHPKNKDIQVSKDKAITI